MRSHPVADRRWLSRPRLFSFVLALGWLLASGLLLIAMAILAMGGGRAWVPVIPVLLCALGAALQRFRHRLTRWGAGCVAVAGTAVVVGTVLALVWAVRHEVTVGGATASVVASGAVVADVADRFRRVRHGRAAIAA